MLVLLEVKIYVLEMGDRDSSNYLSNSLQFEFYLDEGPFFETFFKSNDTKMIPRRQERAKKVSSTKEKREVGLARRYS